jgi:hypothetical protein
MKMVEEGIQHCILCMQMSPVPPVRREGGSLKPIFLWKRENGEVNVVYMLIFHVFTEWVGMQQHY